MSYLKSLQTENTTNALETPPPSLEARSTLASLPARPGRGEHSGSRQENKSESRKNWAQTGGEDVFLEMAVDETNRQALDEARNERRKSRIALAGQRRSLSRQTSFGTMVNDDTVSEYGSRTDIGSSGLGSLERRERRPSILAASRDRVSNGSRASLSRYTRDRSSGATGVREPVAEKRAWPASSARLNEQGPSVAPDHSPDPSLHQKTYNSSPRVDIAAAAERLERRSQTFSDQAESIDSPPASVKTIWDDLDELKSSARRLELNTQARSSSTMRKYSNSEDEPINVAAAQARRSNAAQTYPNLFLALAKAKTIVDSATYRALDRVASDAVDVATTASIAGPQGTNYTAASIINGTSAAERQLRRKADNLCRNVTELCVALCESRSPRAHVPLSNRPTSRDTYLQTSNAESSPLSTLDARRGLLVSSRSGPTERSFSRLSQHHPPTTHRADSRLSNYESVVSSKYGSRRGRIRLLDDDDEDANATTTDEDDPTLRPPSRAATDIGATARASHQFQPRYAREYIRRHPLPEAKPSEMLRLRVAQRQAAMDATSGLASSSPRSPAMIGAMGRGTRFGQGIRGEVGDREGL